MNIEQRDDGRYIVTGETTSKGESIVIKLESEIDSQMIIYGTGEVFNNITLSWILNHSEEKGMFIELIAVNRMKTNRETVEIDEQECIDELVNMVKDNGVLEDCDSIQKAICESYNKLFDSYLENDRILHSNVIVDGLVEVKDNNKILGHGTRFIINNDTLTICEYTGKTIPLNVLPQVNIYKNNKKIICESKTHLRNPSSNISNEVFNENDSIGYMVYAIDHILDSSYNKKDIEYPKLKVPYYFSDNLNMVSYIKSQNTPEDIIKYKIALKGKVEILNINKYMVNEYLV